MIAEDCLSGTPVRLLPVNQHMKQRIALYGDLYVTLNAPQPMLCFAGDLGVSIGNSMHSRNVRLTDIENA